MIQAIGVAGILLTVAQSFEVASVKVHPDPPHSIGITTTGNRLEAQALSVRGLVMWAYDLKNYQLISSPAVMSSDGDTMYDIVAKAEGESMPSKAEFHLMLQKLLADRFRLQIHRETREMPVYDLTVGKKGPKLKESAPDATFTGRLQVNGRNYEVTQTKAGRSAVVDAIANSFPDRPVIDRTGLNGTYDIKLIYTPSTRTNLRVPGIDDISIFTAVQEQLGLKLEASNAPVGILVIDHVEKPSGN